MLLLERRANHGIDRYFGDCDNNRDYEERRMKVLNEGDNKADVMVRLQSF